jgi:putative transposase
VPTLRNGPARSPPTAAWQDRYPAIVKLWRARWGRVHPVPGIPARSPAGDLHNEPESMNARLRKVTRTRGPFPSAQAALKVL